MTPMFLAALFAVLGESMPMPFGAEVSDGGRARAAVAAHRRGADAVAFLFDGGGEVEFSARRFPWGTRYTIERLAVPGAKVMRFAVVRAPWATESGAFANLLTDGRRAVCVRAYDVAAVMRCGSDSLWLESDDVDSLAGLHFAIADGPVDGFRERLQAMTRDFAAVTGVPLPVNGGAFSQTSPATRASYFMVTPQSDLMGDAIDMAMRAGATTLHFKNWWQTIGHYRASTNLFPKGEADFAAAVKAVRAAGLDVSMHSLCTSVGVNDEWVRDGHAMQFKTFPGARYTLASALDEDASELVVNEPIRDGHHRTLTYLGNGNVLRIGGELLQYSDFDRPRRTFTGLVRGAFGTSAAAHPAGAATDYIQQHFFEFFPERTSPLVGEIVDALVSRYRDGGFVQFYFDGIEGLSDRIFEDESCRRIYSGLAAARPPVVEASSYRPHSWWWHSRTGTWDTPVWQLKRFHDLHLKALDDARRIDFLAVGTGWFYPKVSDSSSRGFRRDEIEYFAAKNAGRDYPFSTGIGGRFPGREAPPLFTDAFTIIGWYERLRRACAFAPGLQKRINAGRGEWRLRQAASGEWTARTVTFVQVEPEASARLGGGEDIALRVEPLWGVDTSSARTLVECIGKVSRERPFARSWEFPHASVLPAGVEATTVAGRPAWTLRVKGDGKGGVLRLRVVTPREFGGAEADHLVHLDFEGWRSVTMHDRERDAATDDPLRRYKVFRNQIAPNRISEISLTLEGGPSRTVEVGSLEALTPVAEERNGLAVVVNGERIDVPFVLAGDEYAELEDGLWRKFDGNGLTVGEAPGPRPRTVAGTNDFSVCGEGRATVQVLGVAVPAVAKDLTADQRRILSREYDFARVWNPAVGVTRLEPVVVRPGERARLHVRYVGGPARPVLNVGGVELKEGLNDALFEGSNDVSFSCDSRSPVRIEIAKVYDETVGAEANYAFRRRLLEVHPARQVSADAVPSVADETAVDSTWRITPLSDDPVLVHATRDLKDYLGKWRIENGECRIADGAIEISVDPSLKALQSKVEVGERKIRITGATAREAYQGCIRLEDEMNARGRPALKRGERTYTRLFSPRMTHSGYAVETFPDEYLDQLAHSGMDAILVFIDDPPDVTRAGKVDMPALVSRAAKHGIDVWAYANFPKKAAKMHPLDPGAREWYAETYGSIVRNAPGLKGLICVGESCGFPSRDPGMGGYWWQEGWEKKGTRLNGFWPVSDWPEWLDLVKSVTREHNKDFEVVFWTYNWFKKPAELRLPLLEKIPTDLTLLVTWVRGDPPVMRGNAKFFVTDYSIAATGPSAVFRSEADVAIRRGIPVMTISNCGGRTWDSGVAPYVPAPGLWKARFDALKAGRKTWGLKALMESHHYGFQPNFISDLAKVAFTAETTDADFDAALEAMAVRDFGRAAAPAALAAWKDWDAAFAWHSTGDADFWGPLRVGPVYPLVEPGERLPPPLNPSAEKSDGVSKDTGWKYMMASFSRPKEVLAGEIDTCEREIALLESGVRKIEAVMPRVPSDRVAAARRALGVGKFYLASVRTLMNEKRFYGAGLEGDCAAMLAVIDDEERNVREAIPVVDFDSALGWEPTMGYVCDRAGLEWKLRQLAQKRASVLEKQKKGK